MASGVSLRQSKGLSGIASPAQPVTSLARLRVNMVLETPNSTILSPLLLPFTVNPPSLGLPCTNLVP